MERLVALLAGALFGLGLAISQMVNPEKVLAFLDLAGAWDPSLALVLGGAVGVNFVGYRLVARRAHPLFAGSFHLPTRRDIDRPLVLGAMLFGAGWGLAGYCPGPALSALTLGTTEPLVFVVAMLLGMAGFEAIERRRHAAPA
jgi:uncharacterized membrane protein YedE/YeeE